MIQNLKLIKIQQNGEKQILSGEIEKINVGDIGYNRVLHIVTVDGAGNESEEYIQQIEPQLQNLDITKEILNPKNEYKVGEEVRYSLKFKIRENEYNNKSLQNVKIEDVFDENSLDYIGINGINDNNITVSKENGRLKIKLKDDILNYGETKEIRYSMTIKENANRKRCT